MLNAIVLRMVVVTLALSAVTTSATDLDTGKDFLQCYANSALQSNGGKVICHAGSHFCVKEVTNATRRSDCGIGKHSTDVWDRKLGQCVYRKCSSTCPSLAEDRLRDFNVTDDAFGSVRSFNRTSSCCDTNLCNAARSNRHIIVFAVTAVISLIALSMM
eukprot:scaffold419_cov147-Skeletonema_menzelii.AAC.8